ncbi:MAG: DUF11 domain-containing protein, partial [bacterium]|nr:DUF11 domain-containing protein [bacterium]
TSPAPNAYHGVVVLGSDNRIGPGNVIAFNLSNGVFVGELYADAYPDFLGLTPDYAGVFPVMSFTDDCAVFHSADGITPLDGSGAAFTDNLGARFTGTLSVDAGGDYTFYFDWLDDLARIIVDAAVIMDADHCCDSFDATVYLDSGEHAIELDYVEHGGYANFVPQISGPGVASLSIGGEPGLFGELFQLRLPADGNRITGNRIFNNEGIGIGFNCCCGPTMNDPGDADVGPNTVLNFPELTGFTDHGDGSYTVTGTAPPDSTVEIFGAASDLSGYGEGKQFLDAVAADPAGIFSVTVGRPAEFASFTATATDGDGNTSEFSANLAVVDAVTVGAAEGNPGETVEVPIYVRDLTGTALGKDQPPGNRIQAFTFQVQFEPAASVTEISAYHSGVTAGLVPLFEIFPTTNNTITYIASYDEATNLISFTDEPAPGDEVARLVVTIGPAAPPTPISLTLLDGTLLSNQAGTNIEYPAVIDGLVDVVCPAGEADGRCLPETPDSAVKTLILAHPDRMGSTPEQTASLMNELRILASQPQVLGKVVDLGDYPDLSDLYSVWDADSGSSANANAVLFDDGGIHHIIRDSLKPSIKPEYLILVGDDRVIPLARIEDRTLLFLESHYVSDDPQNDSHAELTPGTTVGQALAADRYLSDDPLALLEAVYPDDLLTDGALFIPDLAVGRLVESPEEISAAIARFISQEGVLDLTILDEDTGHKVQVTAYDFLFDSGKEIRKLWKDALGLPLPHDPDDLEPVDGQLLGGTWNEETLLGHLCGNDGEPYGVLSLNGHATHYELGVPFWGIHGLDTSEMIDPSACGAYIPLNLTGRLLYSAGCHGGLPVAGSTADYPDHSRDLPQTMLSLGALVFVANSGYGWGLRCGIGYGERIVDIFTQELTRGGTVLIGDAVRRTKQRYYMEAQRFDHYDAKSSMQWTFYGFPMYAVKTSIEPRSRSKRNRFDKFLDGEPRMADEGPTTEHFGPVTVERKPAAGHLPWYLTAIELGFDFTQPDAYSKYRASGEPVELPGCPDPEPPDEEGCNGCYYTLNGLEVRTMGATGVSDLPLQPYFTYDSRLAGTSQHGVLWMGGVYQEDRNWMPILGELVSNGDDSNSDPYPTPRRFYLRPRGANISRPIANTQECSASDSDLSTIVVTTGELVAYDPNSDPGSNTTPWIQRLHLRTDMEILYYNNTEDASANCDRTGPAFLGATPYHTVTGTWVDWAVPVSDEAGVWRVVVVYDDETKDAQGLGSWVPLELVDDGTGTWRGDLQVLGTSRLTYFLQAVDSRGNVTWLNYEPYPLPHSEIPWGIPWAVEVEINEGSADLSVDLMDAPDPVTAGDPLTYTIAVTSSDSASSVEVELTLPQAVTYVLSDGEGWSCGLSGIAVTCSRDHLAAGTAPVISVLATAPAAGGTLISAVSVSALETDPTPGNDIDSENTMVLDHTMTDLAVVKEDAGAHAIPGKPITYSITVTNHGPNAVIGAQVTDTFPAEIATVSWECVSTVGSKCTSEVSAGNISDTVDILQNGTLIYTATGTVAAGTVGPIENTATVTVPAGMRDFFPENNSWTVITPPLPADIFSDGFESGDCSRWSSCPLDGILVRDQASDDESRSMGRLELTYRGPPRLF